jgi:hypothetical protein
MPSEADDLVDNIIGIIDRFYGQGTQVPIIASKQTRRLPILKASPWAAQELSSLPLDSLLSF